MVFLFGTLRYIYCNYIDYGIHIFNNIAKFHMNHFSLVFSPIVIGFITLWPLAFSWYKNTGSLDEIIITNIWSWFLHGLFFYFVIVLLYTNVKLFCLCQWCANPDSNNDSELFWLDLDLKVINPVIWIQFWSWDTWIRTSLVCTSNFWNYFRWERLASCMPYQKY